MASALALSHIWSALGGDPLLLRHWHESHAGDLPSIFATTDLAAASTAAAGLAVAELIAQRNAMPDLHIDRRLAAFWFHDPVRPIGWSLPSLWSPVAGDYATRDGWIRLHTNAPHHQAAALRVLGAPVDRTAVAAAVRGWNATALEEAIIAAGGCAAEMRDLQAWAAHPQGLAVAAEPLLHRSVTAPARPPNWALPPDRPLRGLRVLDLTRVLAGPVATRFLAGFGADVLRIDPPWWDEPAVLPGVTVGKRCARLDLRDPADLARFEALLGETDILVHGYRAEALPDLGLTPERRAAICPGLVDVSLNAYGWTGPWRNRRGFDSLVQMSSGIADAGMRRGEADRPVPLPVQALDHATGHILAAAALRGLTERLTTGHGSLWRTSLARIAALLTALPADAPQAMAPLTEADFMPEPEPTHWGPALRLRPAYTVSGARMQWDRPAAALGTSPAIWERPPQEPAPA